MRLIDADVLIAEANKDGAFGYVDAKQIDEAPTIDAVPKWIPCKERLPESNGKYMVTWVGLSGNIYVAILSYGYADDAETNPCWYNYDSEYGECIHHDVTAWMPLPMPYKESEHNEVYETIKRGLEDAVNGRVAEYAPIVRCKDCKWYKDGWCYNPNTFDDEKTRGNTTADWFCADGERKE